MATEADVLAVHVLGGDQRPPAELFGAHTGDDVDKFARCRWTPGRQGVPLLDNCPNRLLGRVHGHVDGGDHLGFVLHVVEARADEPAAPLMFQQVRDLEPGHPA